MGVKGPPPSSTRYPNVSKGRKPLRVLPKAGRPGDPPRWPLSGAAPKVWAEVWRLPQAIAWEQDDLQRVVARYCRTLVAAEKPGATAAMLAEVRQLEDRLGLSSLAMLRLEWVIRDVTADDEEPAPLEGSSDGEGAKVADLDFYRNLG